MGYFPGVTAAAGTVVYRVRQEDVVSGANRIGWMQTFPTYVTVLDPGQVLPRPWTPARQDGRPADRAHAATASPPGAAPRCRCRQRHGEQPVRLVPDAVGLLVGGRASR